MSKKAKEQTIEVSADTTALAVTSNELTPPPVNVGMAPKVKEGDKIFIADRDHKPVALQSTSSLLMPWEGLGTKLDGGLSPTQALVPAGLDFDVELRDSAYPDGKGGFLIDSEEKVVVRMEKDPIKNQGTHNMKLGTVGKRFNPIQNADMALFLEALMETGNVSVETAGKLDSGRKVFFLVNLPGDLVIDRDQTSIKKYLFLASAHDGSMTLRGFLTPVRVVCRNTFNLALRRGQGEGLSVRHTKTAPVRIEEARRIIFQTTQYYDQFAQMANQLVSKPFTRKQFTELTNKLLPSASAREDGAIGTRCLNNRAELMELFEGGTGLSPVAGTAYAALNAVIEYVDHRRGTRETEGKNPAELRANAILWGSGAAMKAEAFTHIRREVGV